MEGIGVKKVVSGFMCVCIMAGLLVGCGDTSEMKDSGETYNDSSLEQTSSKSEPEYTVSIEDSNKVGSIIESLKNAGLPIVHYIVYNSTNDPNTSHPKDGYIAKGNFADSNMGETYDENEPLGGSVELFKTESDAKKRAAYLKTDSVCELGNAFGYQIIKGNVLLRLNTLFSGSYVQKYIKAFGGTLLNVPNDKDILYANKNELNTIFTQEEKVAMKNQFLKSCQKYDYRTLARNPDQYAGKAAVFTGKVVQVIEGDDEVALRVNVTKGKYDIWENTIYVNYTRESNTEDRILEDDIITIYGKLDGLKTYEATSGASISIPQIIATTIKIK